MERSGRELESLRLRIAELENAEYEHKRAEEKTRRQSAVLGGISVMFQKMLAAESEVEVARAFLHTAEDLTESMFGFIGMVNEAGLFDVIAIGDPGWEACRMPETDAVKSLSDMEIRGLWGKVIKAGDSLIINDAASHPDRVGTPEGHPAITSFLGIPLKDADKTIGMISLANKTADYTLDDQEGVETLSMAFLEALKRKQEEKERAGAETLSAIIEDMPDSLLITDAEGRMTMINRPFTDVFGYGDEVLGELPTILVVEEDFPKAMEAIKKCKETGYVTNVELESVAKTGRRFPVLLSISLMEGKEGNSTRMIGVARDITERKELEKERMRMAELERSNQELEHFAYVASHDLQEPLRMVTSYVQLLAKRYRDKLDSDANDFIAYAVDGANRMQQLINDLLTYSRVGSRGKTFGPVDLEEVLDEALGNLEGAIVDNGAVITHDPLPLVRADDQQLVQLFQNLIGNAVKFKGEDPPRIYISALQEGNEWLLSISDNGIGIDPEFNERIFQIFQRLHARGEYSGTGIGLSVCQKIVERHGGRIWVESEPGQGSTFRFTLPVRR